VIAQNTTRVAYLSGDISVRTPYIDRNNVLYIVVVILVLVLYIVLFILCALK